MSEKTSAPVTSPNRRRFRWQVPVALLCWVCGSVFLVGGLGLIGAMVYGYMNFGLFPVRPGTESLNLIAVTPAHIGTALKDAAIGVLLCWIGLRAFRAMRKADRESHSNSTA